MKIRIRLCLLLLLGSLVIVCTFQRGDFFKTEAEVMRSLFDKLSSEDHDRYFKARTALLQKGDEILPLLVQEMNSPKYIHLDRYDQETRQIMQVNRWKIESIIGQISGHDFGLSNACHYVNMNESFDLINAWWDTQIVGVHRSTPH